MSDFLVFTLYGPLVSWGEIAVGEVRHTAMYPTRSALLGMIGAALGIERTDVAGQAALRDGYRFGVLAKAFGDLLRDYHTIQYGKAKRNQVFRTRRDELERGKPHGTHLSTRTYRTDALACVAVQASSNAPHALEELAHALDRPRFVLYLGRKSAPPALPLAPKVVESATMREALEQGVTLPSQLKEVLRTHARKGGGGEVFFWEEGIISGIPVVRTHWRNDEPLSRERWQFGRRKEFRGQEEVHDE
jgi:CRISPR system Cascade subunit CasD